MGQGRRPVGIDRGDDGGHDGWWNGGVEVVGLQKWEKTARYGYYRERK